TELQDRKSRRPGVVEAGRGVDPEPHAEGAGCNNRKDCLTLSAARYTRLDVFETVIYEKQATGLPGGDIAWVTLNRPDKLNALNLQMRDDLWSVFEAAHLDPDVGVVILKGAGEAAFSAGADLT